MSRKNLFRFGANQINSGRANLSSLGNIKRQMSALLAGYESIRGNKFQDKKIDFSRIKRDMATRSLSNSQIDFLREYNENVAKVLSQELGRDDEVKSLKKNEKIIFILGRGKLDFDLEKGEFIIENFDNLKQDFLTKFDNDLESFNEAIDFIKEEAREYLEIAKKEGKIGESEIFLAKNQEAREADSDKQFCVYSEERRVHVARGKVINFNIKNKDSKAFINSLMEEIFQELARNKAIQDAIESLGFDKKTLKRLKISDKSYAISFYPRDDSLILGDKVYQANRYVTENLLFRAEISRNDRLEKILSALFVAKEDLQKTGFKVEEMPFLLEGGCVIQAGDKVYFAISENFYKFKEDNFAAPFFDGKNLLEIEDIEEYSKLNKEWFESQGYEAIEILRNPIEDGIRKYHLDVFMNVIYRKNNESLLIVAKESMTKESYKRLKQDFKQENILELTREERDNLATNFIAINENNVIFGNESLDQLGRVIDFLNENGVNCAKTSLDISRFQGQDGIRCATAEICLEKGPKSVEIRDEAELLQDHKSKMR